MQRLLLFLPRGREAKNPRENAVEQSISVSLATGLDSLDIMSDTKEQEPMTSKSSLKFIRLLRVVFSSQQRLNRPAVNAVQ